MLPEKLVNEYMQFIARNANEAIWMGLRSGERNMTDPSVEYFLESREVGKELKLKFQSEYQQCTAFNDRLDCELAMLKIDQRCEAIERECETVPDFQRLPDAGSHIADPIFKFLAMDNRPDNERLDIVCERLQQSEAFLNKMLKRIKQPLSRWVDIECEQIDGMPTLFDSVIEWAESVDYSDIKKLKSAIKQTQSALDHYVEQLKKIPQSQQLFLGEEALLEILKVNAIPYSPKELSTLSKNFLEKTFVVIDQLQKQLIEKYKLDDQLSAAQLQEWLIAHYRVDPGEQYQGILSAYEQEHEKLCDFVQTTELFPFPDNQALKIIQTPQYLQSMIPAGAMNPPAAFEPGVKTSMVFLTLKPELLDEHSHIGIPAMMLHEGVPGHHLQLAMASMHPSKIRASFSANEHAEGWTTYLEDYVLDQGYCGDLTPEVRFLAKREICRIAARVAIDLYFISGNRDYLDIGIPLHSQSEDPFIVAGELLKTLTGFTDGRVQAELNWYSTERGYPLSYLTGNHMTWELKKKLQNKNPELTTKQQDQLFHKTFLESGNMPMSFLNKVFNEALINAEFAKNN
ncbi:MAG: DUF885 family protein [bacterium]